MATLESLCEQARTARERVKALAEEEPLRAGLLGYADVVEVLTNIVVELRAALTDEERELIDEAMGEVSETLTAIAGALRSSSE